MEHFDECSLNSISYSLIQTVEIPDAFSDDSCTCGHDDMAIGDNGRFFKVRDTFADSNINYGTATEHELMKPYPKLSAERFEAEYDYCMRWASDHKYVAAKVIPFQSNFFSVVRLMFQGRNWVLDCANYDGQYDYCGWLPSTPTSFNRQMVRQDQSLMSDSSAEPSEQQREQAGRSTHTSDTGFGLQSLKTEYTTDSGITKDPIDSGMYKVMGESVESEMQKSLHATLDDLSPILAARSVSDISTNSSLKAVFQDLVELDHIFAQQVDEAKKEEKTRMDAYVESLPTAHSFSDSVIATAYETQSECVQIEEVPVKPKPSSLLAHLACLTGRKLSAAFWKNWTKSKQ